jgi:putative ATP-dependent endonuclease of the OLD family
MLLKRVAVENIRSFLDREELLIDGKISILIGPNGGGKTNLLDAIIVMIRRYLYASTYVVAAPTVEQPSRHIFQANDALNQLVLEPHSQGGGKPARDFSRAYNWSTIMRRSKNVRTTQLVRDRQVR